MITKKEYNRIIELTNPTSTFIICDDTIECELPCIKVKEESLFKDVGLVIFDEILTQKVDRNSLIIGIGNNRIAPFVAATIMRGLRFIDVGRTKEIPENSLIPMGLMLQFSIRCEHTIPVDGRGGDVIMNIVEV